MFSKKNFFFSQDFLKCTVACITESKCDMTFDNSSERCYLNTCLYSLEDSDDTSFCFLHKGEFFFYKMIRKKFLKKFFTLFFTTQNV